jgi:hypothetical protein
MRNRTGGREQVAGNHGEAPQAIETGAILTDPDA